MVSGIDHIGIIVPDITAVLASLRSIYGLPAVEPVDVESRGMKVAVVPFGRCELEIIEVYDEENPLHRQVRTSGSFVHHFALTSDSIHDDVDMLRENGAELQGDAPTVGLRGKLIQFLVDPALGLKLEITEP